GGDAVETVEAPGIGDQAGAFFLEDVPDCALALLGVPVRPGPGDALVGQPAVQILQRLEAEPRREEALAHQTDLVLDLPLLPARRRRAGLRLDKVMAAHLQEATVVAAIPADEDRVHRRLHVMGWTPPSSPSRWVTNLEEESMTMDLLAIDLGKQSCLLHGIDADGVVLSRKVSRAKVVEAVNDMAPKVFAMDACAIAHHWGRWFMGDGRQVRLI